MNTSICPVCGKKHQLDSACPWDFIEDTQDSCADFINERIMNSQILTKRIEEAESLKNKKSIIESENIRLQEETTRLESAIDQLKQEVQQYRGLTIGLDVRKQLLNTKKDDYDSKEQQLCLLKQDIEFMSDYDIVERYTRNCKQYCGLFNK